MIQVNYLAFSLDDLSKVRALTAWKVARKVALATKNASENLYILIFFQFIAS